MKYVNQSVGNFKYNAKGKFLNYDIVVNLLQVLITPKTSRMAESIPILGLNLSQMQGMCMEWL